MKTLQFSNIILLILSACGQTRDNNNTSLQSNSIAKDTVTIYTNISLKTCNCIYSAVKNSMISAAMDSCYKSVLAKYNDSLKVLGFDPSTPAGELKLSNEVIGKLYFYCPELSKLIENEFKDEKGKKLLFAGELVSQTKVRSGYFQVVINNVKSNETRMFYSTFPLDEAKIRKYEPGYEVTVEYDIIENRTTKKEEYHLKEYGAISITGAMKGENQK